MKLFAVALLFLVCVILVVSLVYIIMNIRHKEKMIYIEKGLDPSKFTNKHFLPETLRAATLLLGVGAGFLVALLLDEYVLTSIDNPAIYAGSVILFGGLGLLLFYLISRKKHKN